jgi:hypothetical protein
MTAAPDTKRFLDALRWEHVAMITVLCATIFALVRWGGQDLQTISVFIGALAGVGGYVALRQVRQDSQDVKILANGNLARKDQEIAELQQRLADRERLHTQEVAQIAAQVPSPTYLPQSLAPDSHANGVDATSTTLPLPAIRT